MNGKCIQHTKELLPYQQPLICQSGGKRKVRKKKVESREEGLQGKGKREKKEVRGSENNRMRWPMTVNRQTAE